MEITDVSIFKVDGERLKGYATVIFDNVFIVRDLKIISGNNGLFVAMPNKKGKNGTYRDIAHPLNQEMRETLEQRVIEKYLDGAETS
ncbi:MAG: septation regulator SpoVG [bacterium]